MYRTGKKRAFSIAEALITLMIISLILAAVIPVMSKRQMTSDSMWRYADSGTGANSNIYYGQGTAQTAIIGAPVLPDSSNKSRLVLVTPPAPADVYNDDTIRRSILDFQQKTSNGVVRIGRISFDQRDNTAVGKHALNLNTRGKYNTAIGSYALEENLYGEGNTAIGYLALRFNKSGNENTANGYRALSFNSTGTANTATGNIALVSNTTGNDNTANGYRALTYNGSGSYNVANGSGALRYNVSGNENTANGYYALFSNGASNSYVANPFPTYTDAPSSRNVANGHVALCLNTTGYRNTANGAAALYSNTTGNRNTANGASAMFYNTTGNYNVATGEQALERNTTGIDNVVTGAGALRVSTTGSYNTITGTHALRESTTGDANVANGSYTLLDNTTGSYNVAIGFQAGNGVNSDKKLYIEGAGHVNKGAAALIYGDFAARTLKINGQLSLPSAPVISSDKRLKNVYGFNKAGIEKLNQLQIKNYVYKSDKKKIQRVGVIAQELQKVFPNSVSKGEDGYLYIDTSEMFYAMINAVRDTYKQVQSLIAKVSGLDKRIAKLEKRVAEQDRRIAQIEKMLKKK